MSYQVIARKWRPQTFAEVVGQEHIGRILQNAVRQGRVGHAYLFAGPRGVGKTTTARLLAKALNCAEGPTPDPCNQCEHCLAITAGSSMDVIEIDAASNRGIDEIRALRENVKFAPASARYKIYIIDEVHMLTREAFNALLKTLEEPPAHAVFVLATTDPDKLPPTILSRCQRLTFRRIAVGDIAVLLERIAAEEGFSIDADAALLVARAAGGAVRDAESALEQLLAFGEQRITALEARQVLGKVSGEALAKLSRSVVAGDAPAVVARLAEIVDAGTDPRTLNEELLAFWRNQFLTALGGEGEALAEPLEESELIELPAETWLGWLVLLRRTLGDLKLTRQPRLVLELALVELCRLPQLQELSRLAERLLAGEEPPSGSYGSGGRRTATASRTAPLVGENPPTRKNHPDPALLGPAEPDPLPVADEPEVSSSDSTPDRAGSWEAFLAQLRRENSTVAAFAAEAARIELTADRLTLCFAPSFGFHRERLLDPANRRMVEQAAARFWGRPLTLDSQLDPAGEQPGAAPTEPDTPPESTPTAPLRGRGMVSDLADLPPRDQALVRQALELFDGRVESVRRQRPPEQ